MVPPGNDGAQQAARDLPLVGVFWEQTSFSPFELLEAASDLCRLAWIIGWSSAAIDFPVRVLRRMGTVVDVTGKSEVEIAEMLRPLDLGGLVAFTDPPQVQAAIVAEALRLPFNSPQSAINASDKWAQRTALRAAGIPGPAFAELRPAAFTEEAPPATDVPFPAVLKPRHGAGSRSTFLIRDDHELRAALNSSADEDFVLEEYFEGRADRASKIGANMVSVETVMVHGRPHHLGLTGRFVLAPPFRETGSFFPSDLQARDRAEVLAVADAAIEAVGIGFGAVHTEIKLTPSGPRVIEVNSRVGGNIPGLLARTGGPRLLTLALRLALSLEVDVPVELASPHVAFVRWLSAPVCARELCAVEGLEAAHTLPGVESITLNRHPGDRLDALEGTFGYVVALVGVAGTHDDLGHLLAEVDSKVKLVYR